MCKNLNMFICNGRCGNDKHIGKTTCKNKSVVDYLISSSMCLSLLKQFEILDFSPLYSDVHCPLHFTLSSAVSNPLLNEQTPCTLEQTHSNTLPSRPKRYDVNKSDEFCKNLDINKLDILNQQNYPDTISADEINNLARARTGCSIYIRSSVLSR